MQFKIPGLPVFSVGSAYRTVKSNCVGIPFQNGPLQAYTSSFRRFPRKRAENFMRESLMSELFIDKNIFHIQ